MGEEVRMERPVRSRERTWSVPSRRGSFRTSDDGRERSPVADPVGRPSRRGPRARVRGRESEGASRTGHSYTRAAMTVIAIANQKGGVGKTTTTHSLGDALAADGARVLLVDLDPQACLTYAAGLDPESIQPSLHDVLLGRADAADVITPAGRCALLPASIDLAGCE